MADPRHQRRLLPISAVVMSTGTADDLAQTLLSLADFGQVFVPDGHPGDLPFAYDWVFVLDAGEIVSSRLGAELSALFLLGIPEKVAYLARIDRSGTTGWSPRRRRTAQRLLVRRDHLSWRSPQGDPAINGGTPGQLRGRVEIRATSPVAQPRSSPDHAATGPSTRRRVINLIDAFRRHDVEAARSGRTRNR